MSKIRSGFIRIIIFRGLYLITIYEIINLFNIKYKIKTLSVII